VTPSTASIDWIAVGAVATGLAMLVTATMALFTAKMAAATERMAKSSQDQLDLLRRQATAAEASVEQTERTMGATMAPRLRAQRVSGEEVAATMEGSGFSLLLVNEGPVSATITEARLGRSADPVFLEAVPGGAIDPKGQVLIRCERDQRIAQLVTKRLEIPVRLKYEAPNGQEVYTSFKIKRKEGGEHERWLVTDRETDKAHGSDSVSFS
jgi:hypothetical protein